MTAQIPIPIPGPPAEAIAFLRGVERRASVFAELVSGDALQGDAGLAVAMRAFGNALARAPLAEASTLFWGLLVAAPQLRAPAGRRRWPAAMAGLAALGQGARTAVLLRLAAGLDDEQAAQALRVPPGLVRSAWRRALAMPLDGPRGPFWDDVGRHIEQYIGQLPPDRLVRLAAMRERATRGGQEPAVLRPRWRPAAAGATIVLCVAAIAATFLGEDPANGPRVVTAALPAAATPAATFDADTALLTHRDFEQLADSRDASLVRDLDFYAWYAAQLATTDAGAPMLLPDAARPLPATPSGPPHASR